MTRASKHPLAVADIDAEVRKRFWSKVGWDNGCSPWQGFIKTDSKTKNRYPMFAVQGHQRLATNVAWIIAHGELPPKDGIARTCGNQACVGSTHLKAHDPHQNPGGSLESIMHARKFLKPKKGVKLK